MVYVKLLGIYIMYTEKEKNEFITLRAEGLSFDKISKKLNIPKLTLIRWAKEKEKEINSLKESAFEFFLESLKVTACNRIQMIAKDIQRISAVLKKRSYDYGSTMDLIKLRLFLINQLSKFDSGNKAIESIEIDNEPVNESELEPESVFCAKSLKEFKERVKDKLEVERQAALDFETDEDEENED